ncbi:MAG: hypothetical protein QOH41_1546 [Blastocatellia bacterium]|nr:hypothetical protein [Blastocatellia bacterium]
MRWPVLGNDSMPVPSPSPVPKGEGVTKKESGQLPPSESPRLGLDLWGEYLLDCPSRFLGALLGLVYDRGPDID